MLSFAVYLTHKGIIHVSQIQLTRLGITMDGNLMLLLCTFNCFFAAFLLNRIIEQPFLKLRKRILSAS
jgi:peptidoglycan/LPS O-acetylase OafA/YrhL